MRLVRVKFSSSFDITLTEIRRQMQPSAVRKLNVQPFVRGVGGANYGYKLEGRKIISVLSLPAMLNSCQTVPQFKENLLNHLTLQ